MQQQEQCVLECMKDAHSVRAFRKEPVPKEMIDEVLEAACWAPSAGNLQPWFFYVVRNSELKEKIAQASFEQDQIREAPVVIVVMADPAKANEKYAERGAQLYCLQDTAAAAENMLLAAEALGLGACWVGAFDEPLVQELVEAPPRLRAVAIICLGYSRDFSRENKSRLSLDHVAKYLN